MVFYSLFVVIYGKILIWLDFNRLFSRSSIWIHLIWFKWRIIFLSSLKSIQWFSTDVFFYLIWKTAICFWFYMKSPFKSSKSQYATALRIFSCAFTHKLAVSYAIVDIWCSFCFSFLGINSHENSSKNVCGNKDAHFKLVSLHSVIFIRIEA